MTLQPGFTGSPLDRADHLRTDENALLALRRDPAARALLLRGLDPITGDDGGIGWRTLDADDHARELLFLGLDDGAPRFAALDWDGPRGGSMAVLQLLHRLPAADVALYGGARSLVDWHYRHGFCARCGAATTLFRGGWGRRCAACRSMSWSMALAHPPCRRNGRRALMPPGCIGIAFHRWVGWEYFSRCAGAACTASSAWSMDRWLFAAASM